MDNFSARNNILDKIREALKETEEKESPGGSTIESTGEVFCRTDSMSLLEKFSAEFAAIDGKLEVCREKSTLLKRLAALRKANGWQHLYCDAASFNEDSGLGDLSFDVNETPEAVSAVVTGCECLVARTGTIVLSAAQEYGRALTVYTPVHIVVASADQLVDDVADGIGQVIQRYGANLPSAIFFASGPSRTGDIEKTLVRGVHGPVEVYLFLLVNNERKILADQPGCQSKIIQL